MIQLPQPIVEFLKSPVDIESVLCLPQQYPEPEAFEAFQAGYRYNAVTGENVTGEVPGDFQPGWYVICSNYFDDPFFVDFAEAEAGFPVYYAPHGAGKWTPIPVATTIEQFTATLLELNGVANDASSAVGLIRTFPFADNAFWQEAIQSIIEREAEL